MQKGFTVWFTGLSGAGKKTLSNMVHLRLKEKGVTNVEILDGDDARHYLSKGLGFTREDSDTNIQRLGWVAELLTRHRVPNLVSAVSANRTVREEVRKMIEHTGGKGSFIEVFVDCSVEVCEKRDSKGQYSKARSGELKHFIGIDEPYDTPHNPELRINTDKTAPEDGAQAVLRYLEEHGLIQAG
ncbi:MAG: adenylyl-sulfate kinase [Deltaproteobacteria bacterium]|nr:adenylyl-sulfate kinase [Deltaproteobacteria bacterium]